VRRRTIDRVLYAPDCLAGEAWPLLLGHIADAGASPRLWRVALRCSRPAIRSMPCAPLPH
jgi:hypothetical protein